jgi:hypothetical protein
MSSRYEDYNPNNPAHASLPLYELQDVQVGDVIATIAVEVTDPEAIAAAPQVWWYYQVLIEDHA